MTVLDLAGIAALLTMAPSPTTGAPSSMQFGYVTLLNLPLGLPAPASTPPAGPPSDLAGFPVCDDPWPWQAMGLQSVAFQE